MIQPTADPPGVGAQLKVSGALVTDGIQAGQKSGERKKWVWEEKRRGEKSGATLKLNLTEQV